VESEEYILCLLRGHRELGSRQEAKPLNQCQPSTFPHVRELALHSRQTQLRPQQLVYNTPIKGQKKEERRDANGWMEDSNDSNKKVPL
jgi:hypothetical protein